MLRPTRAALAVIALCLTASAGPVASAPAKPKPAPSKPATPKTAPPKPGETTAAGRDLLYGTIVTDSGKRYTGVLRWGDEEAFWDDMFDGTKKDLPYRDRQPEKDRPHPTLRIIGFIPVGFEDPGESGRRFVARFGDIKEIRPIEGLEAEVAMKSGTKYRLNGGSNDLGAAIHFDDPKAGSIDMNWKSITRILLEPAPPPAPTPRGTAAASPPPKAWRLYGEVTTEGGTFQGFILWDGQECLSTDRLDGDSPEGRSSLEMGGIRAIEKKGDGARVETKDGRRLDLRGTNDVSGDIRGIFVEDERYGRVNVSWQAFRRIDFRDAPGAARGYGDYPPARSLRGTVTDRDGKKWQGRLVFDLDESETWEMLDGSRQGVEYSIPLDRIRGIEPRGVQGTVVTLRNGQRLPLDGSQDVSPKNAGVVVLAAGTQPERYVPWAQVARIDLD